jgi:hypothetical protein
MGIHVRVEMLWGALTLSHEVELHTPNLMAGGKSVSGRLKVKQ